MKFILAFVFMLSGLVFSFGQGGNEQSPLVEKEVSYKDWNLKDVRTGNDLNLRKFISGRRLVMIAYFAPWCPNWKHDVRFVESMYERYHDKGLEIIGVGEYDPVESMKEHIAEYKLTFPVVWESDARTARLTTTHYQFRKAAGDSRNWGSPWYIFLEPEKLEAEGDVVAKKAFVVNGELIQPDAENFIRERLALPRLSNDKLDAASASIEACDPAKPGTDKLTKVVAKP